MGISNAPIRSLTAEAFSFPLGETHSDGTATWDQITMVWVETRAGGRCGRGYTYADRATATLIQETLAPAVLGRDAMDIGGCFGAMLLRIRNLGRPGICSMAISAVDTALWDLKARLLDLPLSRLLGHVRARVPVYGSGGLTSQTPDRMEREFGAWLDQGVKRFKMKIGRDPSADRDRIARARELIGTERELFTDANGSYSAKQALHWAEFLAFYGVSWFEEPVSSDDLEGLRLVRERGPAGLEITAGEYGYDLPYFRRMLEAGSVDVLQADATRCGGFTGFLAVSALCEAWGVPLSSHTAPALHVPVCSACRPVRHLEYFSDHASIEAKAFDGNLALRDGSLAPDLSRPGLGIELKRQEIEQLSA